MNDKSSDSVVPDSGANSEAEEAVELDIADVALEARSDSPLIVVGIGASAGGLEALKELVGGLAPCDTLTYVIAQHLSPTHISLLHELLKPETTLELRDIRDGVEPKPNTIYVTPPNQDVELKEGRLRLVKPHAPVGPKPSVDHLFRTLADAQGENTVGIILSGTGSDGAAGMRAIKAAGGITLVQDPTTAKFDGMPRAALQTRAVDRVVPAGRMGEMLEAIVATPATMRLPDPDEEDSGAYGRVTKYVKRHTGFDLGHYKRTTVDRRLLRRMGLHKVADIEAYAEIVKVDAEESIQLAKDVLISVTSFFRDPEPFEALARYIEQMVRERSANEVIRVWVAGCATGEEAYSIAMMFSEAVRAMPRGAPEFLVFATDLDTDAVALARNGIYPDSAVEGLPRHLRERYFDANGGTYQVKKSLRQSMVFAVQNVVEDPPFSRMDLISCRNLLIYFNRPVQRRVLEIFHYSLRPGGALFLGKSESLELHKELYENVDKKARIFRRFETHDPHYTVPLRSRRGIDAAGVEGEGVGRGDRYTSTFRLVGALVERFCPPSVVVDARDMVVHFTGDLKPFLRFPSGPADLNIYELVHEAVRGELRALIHRARRENQDQMGGTFKAAAESGEYAYHCQVSPLVMDKQAYVVVAFEPAKVLEPAAAGAVAESADARQGLIIGELENELASTRQHLQIVVEELETTNEELLSQSEELQSANEELQSTNEELMTSNEELQSTNEELMTVNDELQSKSQELVNVASDLQAVKESIDLPMLVVNDQMVITHFNRAANAMLPKDDLHPGTSLANVDWRVGLVELLPRIREVIRGMQPVEADVPYDRDRHFRVRITPSMSADNQAGGAVMVFIDE